MAPTRVSECGRFVVIDALHLDRDAFDALARWAAGHCLHIQDAIQLAVCAFNDRACERSDMGAPLIPSALSLSREHDGPASEPLERIG